MKKIILLMLFMLSVPMCYALDLSSQIPANFPKQKPSLKQYTSRAFVEAFYAKWAETIVNTNNTVNTKTLNTEYKGITWGKDITNDVFPTMNLKGSDGKTIFTCTLYSGAVNEAAYSKFKSPILYDKNHNVCVAITSVKDYRNTDQPYFTEPKEMKQYVSVSGYFPNIPQGQMILKELVLVPDSMEAKNVDSYIKNVKKTYDKILKAEERERERAAINEYNQQNRQPSYLDNPADLGSKLIQGGAAYGMNMLMNLIK